MWHEEEGSRRRRRRWRPAWCGVVGAAYHNPTPFSPAGMSCFCPDSDWLALLEDGNVDGPKFSNVQGFPCCTLFTCKQSAAAGYLGPGRVVVGLQSNIQSRRFRPGCGVVGQQSNIQ